MPLRPLQIRPGFVRDATRYSAEGNWFDGDMVRFRSARTGDGGVVYTPETIGGWQEYSTSTHLGTCRAMWQWTALDLNTFTALGTSWKLYLEDVGGNNFDITPIRRTVTLGSNPFTTAATGTGRLMVSDTSHGAVKNDFVTISGATAFDTYTTGQLNKEHQIAEIVNTNSYYIDISGGSSSAPSVSGGGASVQAAYQINTGLDTQLVGTGYGAGPYGRGGYSSAYSISSAADQVRIWSLSNFGEDLLAAPSYGGIYWWDRGTGTASRAVSLAIQAGANKVPVITKFLLVTDERVVFAFGCNDLTTSTQDLLLVRWSKQEDMLDWEPRSDNTAGSLRLGDGSQIMAASKAAQGILCWTDKSLHLISFVGGNAVYGEQRLSAQIGIISPKAAVHRGSVTYWMDTNNFYVYDGTVNVLPCSVKSYVFDDFNFDQRQKTFGGLNSLNNEIWWFYCSSGADDIDSYVAYNYMDHTWIYGSMERAAWLDDAEEGHPLAAGFDGKIYIHEIGHDAVDQPITKRIKTADMDIDAGELVSYIQRILPDVSFISPTGVYSSSSPNVTMKIYTRGFPNQEMRQRVAVRVGKMDIEKWVRVRGRQVSIEIESTELGVGWRLGTLRLDVQPDGRR